MDDEDLRKYMHNSLVESSLMFVRKTVEFFMPMPKEPNGYPDNIYAYHYRGYSGSKWLLSDDDRSELNKRVGHVTVAEVRHGKLDWPLKEWVLMCLGQWIEFFKVMSGIPSELNPDRQPQCIRNARRLSELRDLVRLQKE